MQPPLSFRTIVQAGTGRHGIDARDFHKQLANGTQFRVWIKRRIEEYDLQEGRDFYSNLVDQKRSTNGRGGDRRSKDYLLTLTTAKELAMAEILAAERIEAKSVHGNVKRQRECSRAALNVAGSLLAA